MNRLLVSLSLALALTALPDVAHAAPRHAAHARKGHASSGGSSARKSSRTSDSGKRGTRSEGPRAETRRDAHTGPVERAHDDNRGSADRASTEHDAGRGDDHAAERASNERDAGRGHDRAGGARTVELGGPRAEVVRSVSGAPGRATPNFRPASDRARTAHAEATARTHRDAARAAYVHRSVARHAARHAAATRWHRAYAHRHYAWYQPRGWFVRWAPGRPHYWYHGVFVYGPPPWAPPPPPGHPRAHVPDRVVDHAGDVSVGLRAATYTSAYDHGYGFSDPGLGIAARYRIADPLGVEVQWTYHDASWSLGTPRIEQPLSASVELFAMPWARVNPYLIGGLTLTQRNVQDKVGPSYVDETRAGVGPHVGVGLDLNLSQRTSLTLDARYLAYMNLHPDDATRPGAVQGNIGLNVSF